MTTTVRFATALGTVLALLLSALPSAAQDLPAPIRTAAACAPVATVPPPDAPRIIGATDPSPKMLYGDGDMVVVGAGTARGLQIGQRFFVRSMMKAFDGSAPRAQNTAGWLSVVAVTDATAIARIDFSCDGIASGDHLEPYTVPVLPAGIDRTDASGEVDFSRIAHVLYGDNGRTTGGVGDFMIADMGQNQGAVPGGRYAVYRDVQVAGVPLVAFGEAVVVSTQADNSLIRLTLTRDAVMQGDVLVPRKGGAGAAAATRDAPQLPPAGAGEGNPPRPGGTVQETRQPLRSFTFEDVYFDFDRYTPRPEALSVLDEAVKAVQESSALRIQIEGHTCNIGTAEYNLALGERRAGAVRDYLISRGIPAGRLTTISYGEERPKHDNSREETRRLNRRAALVVNLQQ